MDGWLCQLYTSVVFNCWFDLSNGFQLDQTFSKQQQHRLKPFEHCMAACAAQLFLRAAIAKRGKRHACINEPVQIGSAQQVRIWELKRKFSKVPIIMRAVLSLLVCLGWSACSADAVSFCETSDKKYCNVGDYSAIGDGVCGECTSSTTLSFFFLHFFPLSSPCYPSSMSALWM